LKCLLELEEHLADDVLSLVGDKSYRSRQ